MDSLSQTEALDPDTETDPETSAVADALVGLSGLEHPEFAAVLKTGECPRDAAHAIQNLMQEAAFLRETLAEAYKQIAELENLADRDWLVPALNRRAFMKSLNRAISFGERYGNDNSVLFLDVNGMKTINDTHGHAAGDAALIHIAATLNSEVRNSDVVGRLGGDEFAVLLVQSDREMAAEKSTALVKVLRSTPAIWEGKPLELDAACGVHQVERDDDADSALEKADRAMYADKKSPRNRPDWR